MSKRRNENINESPAAAKMIRCQQDESNVSSPEQKIHEYHQGYINVSPLYLATEFKDVDFVFDSTGGTVTRIPAHKNLLAMASNVFKMMFCGGLKETGDVKIVDASAAAFKEFLQFFYLNNVKLTAKHVASVLYLGNKYNVENCVDACVKFLADELSNENVCTALSLAILHDQKELVEVCEKQILLNTADTFKSAGFLECSKDVLAHILKMKLLSCPEVNVFDACMEWVRAKSQQQVLSKELVEKHLGDLYYQIRFASMTTKEFCQLKTKYSAVLSSDFEAIIRLIERLDTHSEYFNTFPRQVEWNDDRDAIIVCNRDDRDTAEDWQALDIEKKTTFSISEPLLLGKFRCNAIYFGKNDAKDLESDLLVKVTITEARTLDDANVKILSSMTATMDSEWTTVSLPNPILIRPDLFYTICIKKFPNGHYYKSHAMESSMSLDSNIKIEFHNDKVDGGKVVELIYELFFNKV